MDKVISQRKLKRELKELRVLIDTNPDPITARIAYAMEQGIRYATEAGIIGWETLEVQAQSEAKLLKQELKEKP